MKSRTTMRRLLLSLALLLPLVAACVACLFWPSNPGPISRANLQRITTGMTEAEVAALLGGRANVEGEARL